MANWCTLLSPAIPSCCFRTNNLRPFKASQPWKTNRRNKSKSFSQPNKKAESRNLVKKKPRLSNWTSVAKFTLSLLWDSGSRKKEWCGWQFTTTIFCLTLWKWKLLTAKQICCHLSSWTTSFKTWKCVSFQNAVSLWEKARNLMFCVGSTLWPWNKLLTLSDTKTTVFKCSDTRIATVQYCARLWLSYNRNTQLFRSVDIPICFSNWLRIKTSPNLFLYWTKDRCSI